MTKAARLVEVLNKSHQSIVDTLSQIQLVMRSYAEARVKLNALSEALLVHFGQQDEGLFQRLSDFYASDRQAIKMLEFLSCDLKDIKVQYLMFFEKYTGYPDSIEVKSFSKEFADFMEVIIGRLEIEEEYLFPMLEQLAESER